MASVTDDPDDEDLRNPARAGRRRESHLQLRLEHPDTDEGQVVAVPTVWHKTIHNDQ